LIIGDEVLNGKIRDTNSNAFARFCFRLGISMRHVAVVPDEESDIVETLNRLRHKYDFIVTSGGIGPTHDDITYESIAKAYGLPLKLHDPTVERMKRLGKYKYQDAAQEIQDAQLRMTILPFGNIVEYHYTSDELWVPVVAIEGRVYILPGIPSLFEALLNGIKPQIEPRVPSSQAVVRFYVSTQMGESAMAPYLSTIQERYGPMGVKIGSYPHWIQRKNTVSIIGPESELHTIRGLVADIERNVEGTEISADEEAENSQREAPQ
jgi:molybdenum cofactor synthesis domain-containing protein